MISRSQSVYRAYTFCATMEASIGEVGAPMQPERQRVSGTSPELTPFARALRSHRLELGLSQFELAQQLGVRTQTISHWERAAKTPQPRFDDALVRLLGLSGRGELRRLQGVGVDGIVELLPFAHRRGDHLATTPPPSGTESVNPTQLLNAALKIIDAREGSLNEVEAEIVRTLLTSAGEAD